MHIGQRQCLARHDLRSFPGFKILRTVVHVLLLVFSWSAVALPAGVSDLGDSDRYSLEFFMQGPALGDASDDEAPTLSKGKASKAQGTATNNPTSETRGARWFVPLADGAHPEELEKVVTG